MSVDTHGAGGSVRMRAAKSVMLVRALAVCALLVLGLFSSSLAHAQTSEGLVLRTGFVPDPIVLQGQAVAEQPLSRLSADCPIGFSSAAPSHRIELSTRFGFLRVFATGSADLVMAIRDRDGNVVCSDDRFGIHPSIEGRFSSGPMEIWIGVKDAEAAPSVYTVRITETRSLRPGAGTEGGAASEGAALLAEAGLMTTSETGSHDAIRLRRGFLPDPRTLAGQVEAPPDDEEAVDLSQLGSSCRGFVTRMPSHVVTLRDEFAFLQIYLAPSDANLSLVVLGPDGTYGCAGADDGRVGVTRPRWPAGVYRVWVGAREEDTRTSYELGISELRHVREPD